MAREDDRDAYVYARVRAIIKLNGAIAIYSFICMHSAHMYIKWPWPCIRGVALYTVISAPVHVGTCPTSTSTLFDAADRELILNLICYSYVYVCYNY